MQADGTWLNSVGVTIQEEAFKHILIHSVLPQSNWEWGRIAQSESLTALHWPMIQCWGLRILSKWNGNGTQIGAKALHRFTLIFVLFDLR